MNVYNLDNIKALAIEPDGEAEFNEWTAQKNIVNFLDEESKDEYIIIYASLPHTFIHSVFIPEPNLKEKVVNDLLQWSCDPYSSWGLTCSTDDAWIEPPLSGSGSDTLKSGEQILFIRSFVGKSNEETYYELNQKFAHVLDVHFVPERKSWCKLDSHGDLDDIVKIIKIDSLPRNGNGTIICAKKEVLGKYCSVANLSLLRMYDFTRYKSGEFSGWDDNREEYDLSNSKCCIYGSVSISPGTGSYSRGIQVLNVKNPKENVIDSVWGRPQTTEAKQYCSYIAHDWKNKIISEISCNPSCLANYFTKSDLPFEITPAFFKPDVLLKYKSDYAKYKLGNRSVDCRGAWHLKTFDINSAGQVHTYLIYLSQLPYEEQLHWKQYNEKPKAPLSKRAIKTDFDGEFWDGYDPLPSLKRKLDELHNKGINWWKLRDNDAPDKVHYPFTSSKDEWADEILHLDQLLVEGLEEKWLRKKAKELGATPDPRLRPLKLVEILLVTLGFEEEHAREIMSPFHTVHNYRSILKGHTSGSEAETIRRESLTEHGSFRKHFEKLCSDCDESIEIITESFIGI
jgi:hypothetical protein